MKIASRLKIGIKVPLIASVCSLGLSTNLLAKKEKYGPIYKDLNFGVVVKNSNYTIYRSEKLGEDGLEDLKKFLKKKNLPFPKTIIHMNRSGYKFPHYFAIEEWKELQRQEKYGPVKYYHPFELSFRTYVDGMNPYNPKRDIDKDSLGSHAKKYFKANPNDGVDGGMDAVFRVLSLVLDPANQPVLFHCLGGKHRTGMIAMIIRYMQGGDWVDGPTTTHWGRSFNPAQDEYYKYAGIMWRKENIEFIEKFAKDTRFSILQEHLGPMLREE